MLKNLTSRDAGARRPASAWTIVRYRVRSMHPAGRSSCWLLRRRWLRFAFWCIVPLPAFGAIMGVLTTRRLYDDATRADTALIPAITNHQVCMPCPGDHTHCGFIRIAHNTSF